MAWGYRLFALGRLVDVLLFNLHRIRELWPLLAGHLAELLSDGKPGVRGAAVDALARALTGALSQPTPAQPCASLSRCYSMSCEPRLYKNNVLTYLSHTC